MQPVSDTPFDRHWRPDRSRFRDDRGTFFTQALFLELAYDPRAIYTLQHDDRMYKGEWYPSIRRLYVETMDPTEYEFAKRYFFSWEHWQKTAANAAVAVEVQKWRDELAAALRAAAVAKIVAQADTSFQAAKWLADNGIKPLERKKASVGKKPGSRVDENATNDAHRITQILQGKRTTEGT
jgi:hypothetical protein